MPQFQRAATNKRGTPVYMYALSPGESASAVAQTMSTSAASAPQFTYVEPGAPVSGGHAVGAGQLDMMLSRGGLVRGALTTQTGSTVTIQIENGRIMLIPSDGQQATCDAVLGIGGDGFGMGYGDPYSSAGTGGFSDGFGGGYQQQPQEQYYGNNGYGGDPYGGGYGDTAMMPGTDPYGGYGQPGDYQQQGFSDGFGSGYEGPALMEEEPLADPRAQQGSPTSKRNDGTTPVKIGTWIITLILLAIPVVNIVFLIVSLASKKTNPSKKSYVGAVLILWIVCLVLMSGSVMLFGDAITAALQNAGVVSASTQTTNSAQNTNTSANANTATVVPGNGSDTAIGENVDTFGDADGASDAVASPVSVTIDNSSILMQGDRRVIVINANLTNNSADVVVPGNVLTINAMQGDSALAQFNSALDGFDPNSANIEIQPGTTGPFSVAFILGNEDPVDVDVMTVGSNEMLAENQFPGV